MVGKSRKIRILVAKPGARRARQGGPGAGTDFPETGMEVIYSGLLPTPDEVAQMAVDEDVDVVALSLLNGAHLTAFPRVKKALERKGGKDIVVVGGGIIPKEDKPKLARAWDHRALRPRDLDGGDNRAHQGEGEEGTVGLICQGTSPASRRSNST